MFSSLLINLAILRCFFLQAINAPCDKIPELNQKIIVFVNSKLNKKVGRGECWDLAAEALNITGAVWDKKYGFGREIKSTSECVFPGDIIQFEQVEVMYENKGTFYVENMEHHTAIIFKVKEKGNFILAEQNTSSLGKKVGLNPVELKNIRKGKYSIFRPVRQ
jgi:hypothetical protein